MFDFDPGIPVAVIAGLASVLFIIEAARRVHVSSLSGDELNLWGMATMAVFIGHQMTAHVPAGIELHYLGGAALALVLGYPRAILSMALILVLDALLQGAYATLGLRVLLAGILPVLAMTGLTLLARRWLPRNLFIFLLGCGFFGLFAVYALQQVVTFAVRTAIDPLAAITSDGFLPYALLLAGGEATLEGMIITVMVVVLPGSVRLFDETFYLSREHHGQNR